MRIRIFVRVLFRQQHNYLIRLSDKREINAHHKVDVSNWFFVKFTGDFPRLSWPATQQSTFSFPEKKNNNFPSACQENDAAQTKLYEESEKVF